MDFQNLILAPPGHTDAAVAAVAASIQLIDAASAGDDSGDFCKSDMMMGTTKAMLFKHFGGILT